MRGSDNLTFSQEKFRHKFSRSYLSYSKFAYGYVSPRTVKEDEKRLQNELRQVFIDKYRTGHFDSIQSLKKVIKECQKLLKEAEKPTEKKRLQKLIKRMDKELLKLKDRTPQVLKNSNRMQRQLDSIR